MQGCRVLAAFAIKQSNAAAWREAQYGDDMAGRAGFEGNLHTRRQGLVGKKSRCAHIQVFGRGAMFRLSTMVLVGWEWFMV